MRIGLFTDSYIPRPDGIAIAVETMREGLEQAGHEVHVFCPSRPGVRYPKNVHAFHSAPSLLYEGLRTSWPFWPINTKMVKDLNLDIIHIHTPLFVGQFGMTMARKLGIPVALTCHSDLDLASEYPALVPGLYVLFMFTAFSARDWSNYWRRRHVRTNGQKYGSDLAKRLYGYLSDNVDAVIVPSQKMRSQLLPYIKESKLHHVANGLDVSPAPGDYDRPKIRNHLSIPLDANVLITTSRPVVEKRIDYAVRILARLVKKAEASYLIIVGDGPERSKLKLMAKRLGVYDTTRFIGAVSHEEVFSHLAAADIYINPCLRETFGLSIAEAALMQKPLLLFDEQLSELLDDGKSGYFVTSVADAAAKADNLFKNPSLLQAFGQHGRQLVRERFSREHHTQGLIDTYQSVIKKDAGKTRTKLKYRLRTR